MAGPDRPSGSMRPGDSAVLVYVDMNVLGSSASGRLDLPVEERFAYVVSTEHLQELSRGTLRVELVERLDTLRCCLLRDRLNTELKFENQFELSRPASFSEVLRKHRETVAGTEALQRLFDPVYALLHGADCEAEVEGLPQRARDSFRAYLRDTMCNIPGSHDLIEGTVDAVGDAFEQMTRQLLEHRRDHEGPLPAALGLKGGWDQAYSGPGAAGEVWARVAEFMEGVRREQMLGHAPPPFMRRLESRLSLVGAAGFFDAIGFRAEGKKLRTLAKIPNVLSDAGHLRFASLCDEFWTEDDRLAHRAEAIFGEHQIPTRVRNPRRESGGC